MSKFLALSFLLFLISTNINAQVWTQYTKGSNVDAITEYNGEIWVANDGGLVRLDSNGIPTFYNTANSDLPSHFIYDLQVLSDNRLYIGTGEGLFIYDGNDFEHIYDLGDGGTLNIVSGIAEDSQGNTWISVLGMGLLRRNGSSWDVYSAEEMEIPHNTIRQLHIDKEDRIWLGYRQAGLAFFDPLTETSTHFDENNSVVGTKEIRDITSLENGDVWIAAIGGLFRYTNEEWEVFLPQNTPEINGSYMYSLTPGVNNDLWIGTHGGLLHYNGEWRMITEFSNNVAVDFITAVLQDSSGKLWAGTNNNLYSRSNLGWRDENVSISTIPNNYIAAVRETDEGTLWLGAFEGNEGLYSYDGSNFSDHTAELPLGLYNGMVELEVNSDGWIAAAAGFINEVYVYDGNEWISRTLTSTVNQFNFDENNDIWATTIRGLYKISNGVITLYDMSNTDMASDRHYGLEIDKDGIIYVASREGLISYDGNTWGQVDIDNAILDNGEVNGVFIDNQDRLWVAHDFGISVREGNTWTNYDPSNSPIPEDPRNYRFIQDNQGVIWSRMFKGLMKIDGADWTLYTTLNSGMLRNDAADITPAIDGGIWIASSLGLVYHSDESTSLTEAPTEPIAVYTYPNPSLGEVQVRLQDQANNIDISLVDVEGKIVLRRQDLQEQEFQITLPETKGVYWLQVRTDKGLVTKKLIKQ